jgi:GAF domain-containing protein
MDGPDRMAAARRYARDSWRKMRANRARAYALGGTGPVEPEPRLDAAELVRLLHAERTMLGVLDRVVELARRAVPGCRHASVTLPGPTTPAATDRLARRLDNLQYSLGEGPCLAAIASTAPVLAPDLDAEKRWPEFAAVAVRAGVASVLSCRLGLGDEPLGSLNFYAAAVDAFGAHEVLLATTYAGYAAAALGRVAEHEQAVQLRRAVAMDPTVGLATGLLMGTRWISEAEAFDLLRAVSKHTDRTLRDVAAEVVRHRGALG